MSIFFWLRNTHPWAKGIMKYRQYGTGGPDVSRLSFGAMRLPLRNQRDNSAVNFTKSRQVIRHALENGVNFIDSHHQYHGGNSEVAVGRALKGWKGHRVYLQTKTPWYREDVPVETFERILDRALVRLGVDCIDYLLHHAMSMDTWKKRGKKFLKCTDKAINKGIIAARGFSSHETPENIKAFVDTGEFQVMLVSYNWMNPEVGDAIAYAADKGMGVSVMNPLGGGTLTVSTPEILRLLPGSKSSVELALRYVLGTRGVATTFSGMNTIQQVDENVAVGSRRTALTEKQSDGMSRRLAKMEKMSTEFCTSCGYCMPCEQGVDIPNNFKIYQQSRLLGLHDPARRQYASLVKSTDGENHSASACTRCGACEPKCPNKIPIIEQLAEVSDRLG